MQEGFYLVHYTHIFNQDYSRITFFKKLSYYKMDMLKS